MNSVITQLEHITPEWLTDRLRQSEVLTAGRVESVDVSRKGGAIVPLQLSYSADAKGLKPDRLVFKFSRLIEGRFYRDMASEMGNVSSLLKCYDVQYDVETGRSHQLFTDISPTHFDPPELLPVQGMYAEQVADALADIHAHWWEHPRLKTDIGAVVEDAPGRLLRDAQTHFAAFVDYLGDRLPTHRRNIYERVLAAMPLPAWRERMQTGKQITLTHGDAHWWNFMYPHNPATDPVYVIDWEAWHVNIGITDLAYTVGAECFPAYRQQHEQQLTQRYHQRLLERGVRDYTWEQCWLDYRMAAVYHVLWPISWHKHLSPNIWWTTLECSLSTFEDLGCMELI